MVPEEPFAPASDARRVLVPLNHIYVEILVMNQMQSRCTFMADVLVAKPGGLSRG